MKLGVCPKCEVPLPFGYIRCPRCDVEIDSAQSVPEVHAGPPKPPPTTRRVTDTQRMRTTQRFATGRIPKKPVPAAMWVAAVLALGLGVGGIVALSGSSKAKPIPRPIEPIASTPTAPPLPPSKPWVAASEKLRSAKAYLKQNLIDEAQQAAEDSLALFRALPLDPEINEEIRQADELVALCGKLRRPEPLAAPILPANDVRPAPPMPKEPPKPEPRPVAPKQVTYESFAPFLSANPPALTGLAPKTPLGRSVYAVAVARFQREWPNAPEDQALLNRYVDKFYKTDLDHEQAAVYLLDEISKLRKETRLPASRLMAIGHLDMLPESRRGPLSAKYAVELELIGATTAEGKTLEILRGISALDVLDKQMDAADSIREPLFKTTRGLLWIQKALQSKEPAAFVQAADFLSRVQPACPEVRPAWTAFKTSFAASKACKRCDGTNQLPCDYGCDSKGQITKRCGTCNGTGRMPFTSSPKPCPEKRTGPHTWTEKCPKCAGTLKQPCRSCKAPWQPPAELISKPCSFCSSKGWLHADFKTLCPLCYGIGATLSPGK